MDVVVTVPKARWAEWIEEGDLALPDGRLEPAPWEGRLEYGFTGAARRPCIAPGERVYIVAHGHLRGYAPLQYIDDVEPERFGGRPGGWALVRHGGAVALTLAHDPLNPDSAPLPIRGFQGWRYRWWDRAAERPFPDWQTEGVT